MMSKKKLSALLIGLALIAITGFAALSQTWSSATFLMRLVEADPSYKIGVYWCCDMLDEVTEIDWGAVTAGERYIRSIFVANQGTKMLYLTYLPTWYENAQYKFHIECFIHMEGTPCQLNKPPTPIPMEEKDPITPEIGYMLYAGCMVKIDILLTIEVIEAGMPYEFDFQLHGYSP